MPSKPTAPQVSYYHDDANGQHQIGVKVGGVFVPFVSQTDQSVQDRVEALKAAGGGGEDAEAEEGGE